MRRYKECIKYVFYFLEQTFYGPLFTLYSPFVERDSSKNGIKIENCIPPNGKNVKYHWDWQCFVCMDKLNNLIHNEIYEKHW